MVRLPAVAGRFYPDSPSDLSTAIAGFLDVGQRHRRATAVVVPHAGYIYSGRVAGAAYSRIDIPARVILLGPNHTGLGPLLSIMRAGSWRTPLGDVVIDTELADALIHACSALEDDKSAHEFEHAIEVQLPFLQHAGNAIRIVPIVVGTSHWNSLAALGEAMGQVIAAVDPAILMVASSDMNHYESDAITRVKDARAIERILELDAKGLYETVRSEKISMCGFGPAAAMLTAAVRLGGQKAELVRYATSADASGDKERVVGYAGITVYPKPPAP